MRHVILLAVSIFASASLPSAVRAQADEAASPAASRHVERPPEEPPPPIVVGNRWNQRRLSLNAGAGIFSPTGFAGGHVTFSFARWRVMAGGGAATFYDIGWRAAFGVGLRIMEARRDAMVAEVWASISDVGPASSDGGRDVFVLGHAMLGWEVLTARGFTVRAMGGLATGFGPLDPCSGSEDFCIDSPVVPSAALTLGYAFDTGD